MNRNNFPPPVFRRLAGRFLAAVLLLGCVGAVRAQNNAYLLRYVNIASGAVTFTGNTLGLAKLTATNAPGQLDSIGAFTTLDTNSQVAAFPPGTTLNWSNNAAAAVLRLPANSSVLYAELIWGGSAQSGSDTTAAGNVLGSLDTPVQFILPDGSTNSIAPDPVTASVVTNATASIFYVRSANVTALVAAAGAGTYAAGGVPGTVLASEDANNACGWTLAVVYANSGLHERNLSLFVGNSFATANAAPNPPVAVTGFCAPPSGVVQARLFVSALEGDPNKTGDQMLFGVTTDSLAVLSGPNNLADNFFGSQINGDDGLLDTSGTFGLSNSVPGSSTVSFSARQGWDITSVDVSAGLTNGVTAAYAQNITQGDGYSVNALALQIDVGSPVLATAQSVDKASTFVGDILTYTVVVTNSGTADAVNLLFTDPLPFGTSYVTNTFATNGVLVAGAYPVNGVPLPRIPQNSALTVTYQVQVDQIPPSAKFITAATIAFQFTGACANSPIINGTLVNADVQTLVPLLLVNKQSSLTNIIPGATMTYTINVPNVGTTNTTGTTLIDPIPAGVTYITNTTTLNGVTVSDLNGTNMPYTLATEIHGPGRPAGIINVGDTAVVAFQVKISATPPLRINNSATIYANGIAPTSAQNAAANITPVYADLAVGIVGSPNPVRAGDPISYTVSLTNLGPNTINAITNFITLTLPLADAVLLPAYTPGTGTYDALDGIWSGLNLPSNGVVTLTITGYVDPSTTASGIVSSVLVTPPPGVLDLATNNNVATYTNAILQVADLAVTVSDGVTNVYQGDPLTYVITIVNLGPSTLNSLNVSNALPAYLASPAILASEGVFNPFNGNWNGLNLAPGKSVALTVQATILTNVLGAFTNSVLVSVLPGAIDPVLTNNSAADVDYVYARPVLGITKTGPATVYAGTNYDYSITVTNTGLTTASNLVVGDTLPTNLVFVAASGNGALNAGVVTWNIDSLAVNAASNLTLTVAAPAFGNATNVAVLNLAIPGLYLTNNISPPVSTTVLPVADLAIGKTGPAYVLANSNFTYTISITNFGPSTAASLAVTDALPAGLVFISSLPVAATNAGNQVIWTNVGDLAAGATTNLTLKVKATVLTTVTNLAAVGSPVFDPALTNNVSPPVVTAVTNLPPLANPDSYSITENTANTLNPLANDVVRTPGGSLTIIGVSATNGTASISGGTNIVFIPATNFVGIATIGYTITDNVGGTNSSVITVTVTNALPTANGQSVTTSENTALPVTLAGNDPAGRLLTFIIVSPPTNGVLTLLNTNTGAVTYTPNTNYAGADAFSFRVNNGLASSSNATVAITVVPVANLSVTESGPTNGVAGSNLVYTITVTNLGPATATNILVTNQLPAGFTFITDSAAGIFSNGLVVWTIPALPANGKTNFTVTAYAAEGGTYTNLAAGGSATLDLNLANNNGTLPNAATRTVVSALADVAVFKDGGTNVYAGQPVFYVITATNAGPSTASNVVVQDTLPAGAVLQSASGSYSVSNGIVTWPGVSLAPNAAVAFNLTVAAPASAATLLNIAAATSPTPDPNPTNNNGSSSKSRVTTKVVPSADLIVLLSGPATALQGSNFIYSLVITNAGPSIASNIVVSDIFPSNLVFVSASGGGILTTNVITWPKITALPVGGVTNYVITARSVNAGVFTNSAAALAATFDPNLTNNSGVLPAARVQTTVGAAQFGFLQGVPVFNPQTGLYEESVAVTNTGAATVAGFRLYVGGLRSGVSLYNADGTNNGLPYVSYNFAVDPGNFVKLILEFYNPSRLAFTNTLSAEAVLPPDTSTAGTNGSVSINRIFPDNRSTPARVVIEFTSVPGKTYTILYATNLAAAVWKVATPTVTANANVTQWYDDGPPKTDSNPALVSNRYYRVIQN